MIASNNKARFLIFAVLVASITLAVVGFYPYARKLAAKTYRINYYSYNPSQSVQAADVSKLQPAVAVPILMYHGVTASLDDSNTTIANFVSDMEMLKKNGYQTISVAEYDAYKRGEFVLPPKPIIITFDDGRKDSYYTTDDVFKKLGFKATIFVASGPAIDGNSFYLTWKELQTMKASGRWEIQAHGRYSHIKIPIVPGKMTDSNAGRYLTSKMYLVSNNRIETVAEFENRVENDYVNGINDLKTHVGVIPQYFAIPLNDYGQQPESNYDLAVPFNQMLIKKYFKLAFIQVNSPNNITSMMLDPYNFKNEDPYKIKRIEVMNMSAGDLETVLNDYAPVAPALTAQGVSFKAISFNTDSSEGVSSINADGLRIRAPKPDLNGQSVAGQTYWQNYSVKADLSRTAGRSIALLFYYKNSSNYMSFGRTDSGYFLRSTVNGVTKDLQPSVLTSAPANATAAYEVTVKNGQVSCFVNGFPICKNIAIPLDAGAVGFRVWSDTEKGAGIVHSLDVKPV